MPQLTFNVSYSENKKLSSGLARQGEFMSWEQLIVVAVAYALPVFPISTYLNYETDEICGVSINQTVYMTPMNQETVSLQSIYDAYSNVKTITEDVSILASSLPSE